MKKKTKRILFTLGGTIAGVLVAKGLKTNQAIGVAIGSTIGNLLADEI